jgi:23S rRNA (cytidine1920-2'-O)/16S rRNA (cytidine1409-2'-O)-methyltransferase
MGKTGDGILDGLEYVSRGGQKLEKALAYFGIEPEGKVCLDCGASTGGFTDCLLKRGAQLIYAIDVGYGQLAWSLRNDRRVITMERTNIRHVTVDMFETKPELAVIDVSFISLSLVLPVIRKLLIEAGEAVCLIKPQFEAGRGKVGKKGVVRDPGTHKEVLSTFIENAENSGFIIKGITYSPVKGPKGNIEYLGWLGSRGESIQADVGLIVLESHKELV